MKIIKPDKIPTNDMTNHRMFTPGSLSLKAIINDPDSDLVLSKVSFGKGVRNKFHTHTAEQVLIITSGRGYVATETEKIEVECGDIIRFAAGEKHWHGAHPDSEFSHIFVTLNGYTTTQIED